jgi:hypothetical protein
MMLYGGGLGIFMMPVRLLCCWHGPLLDHEKNASRILILVGVGPSHRVFGELQLKVTRYWCLMA